jgi:hypothetical protein
LLVELDETRHPDYVLAHYFSNKGLPLFKIWLVHGKVTTNFILMVDDRMKNFAFVFFYEIGYVHLEEVMSLINIIFFDRETKKAMFILQALRSKLVTDPLRMSKST